MNMNRSRPGLGLGFALGVSINNQTGADTGGGASFSFGGNLFSDFLGGSSEGSATQDGTTTEKLNIDEEGLLRLIDKSLEGVGGLASIFGGEAGAGLFGSSSAKLQTEDLLAKIAGELAQVTAEKVTDVKSRSVQQQESGGGLGSIIDMFKF